MKASDILGKNGELNHKLRTTSDLIRHIETRSENTSNYCLLLGAGCSVTSGIKSASVLIEKWLYEIYEIYNDTPPESIASAQSYFEKEHASWYNPGNPYASLFEKRYDLPSQRRRFVEKEVDCKAPSIGYAYLTSLIDKGFFNTVFTTNFDDLINEAFYQFSNNRPISCAHDSAITSISVTSNRPKIIKLHGDYLFDDIKSTLKETESLEQNIKGKLVEFCKEFGLIVIGYSGNDRSIMDVLEYLSKQENYLKNGIYWCLRNDDNISHSLRNLLWKDKIYPVLIDGFDEFMAKSHNYLANGNLDIESNLNHSNLQNSIKFILEDSFDLAKNDLIKNDINNLKNNSSSHEISGFLQELNHGKERESTERSLSDTRNLLEIDTLISKKDFKIALGLCDQYFYRAESPRIKSTYIKKIIKICKFMDDYTSALRWSERLLEIDQYNPENILIKSNCIENNSNKFNFLSDSLKILRHSYQIINQATKVGFNLLKSNPEHSPSDAIELIQNTDRSISLDPSLDNPAWEMKYTILQHLVSTLSNKNEINDRTKDIEDLISKSEGTNPVHETAIEIKSRHIISKKSYKESISYINNLYETYKTASLTERKNIDFFLNDLISSLPLTKDKDKKSYKKVMGRFYEEHLKPEEKIESITIKVAKANYLIGQKKDLIGAKEILESLISKKDIIFNIHKVLPISRAFSDFDYKSIYDLIIEDQHSLNKRYFHEYVSAIAFHMEEYESAIRHIEKAYEHGISLEDYLISKSYYLIKSRKFEDLLKWGEKFKDVEYEAFQINYNYAAKSIDSPKYNEVLLRNLSAQSKSISVRICAFSILGNDQQASLLIKETIDEDYNNYFSYRDWPILEDRLFEITPASAVA